MTTASHYAAFISYSSKDTAFAKRLHRALESYVIPRALGTVDLGTGSKPNRIYPVFRDREEMPAGDLGEGIERCLTTSGALIVVCSPSAADSPWVQREVEYFLGLGRKHRIFAIITDDAPPTDGSSSDAISFCFPAALRGGAVGDPNAPEILAADARSNKDGFRRAWLKVVAGMIGKNAGQLIDRDMKRRQQRTAFGVASILLFVMTALAAVVQFSEILKRNRDADEVFDYYERRGRVVQQQLTEQAGGPGTASAQSFHVTNSQDAATVEASNRAADVRRAMDGWENSNVPRGALPLVTLRKTFEDLHRLHLEALRQHQQVRAAVIATQINTILIGKQVSYLQEPSYYEFSYSYLGHDLPLVLDKSSLASLRDTLTDQQLADGAASIIVSKCDRRVECIGALADVLTASDASEFNWDGAAEQLCKLKPDNKLILPHLNQILADPKKIKSHQSYAAFEVVKCLRIFSPEIIAGISQVLRNPQIFSDGRFVYNDFQTHILAADALTALGPAARGALPALIAARDRWAKQGFDHPVEKINRAIASLNEWK